MFIVSQSNSCRHTCVLEIYCTLYGGQYIFIYNISVCVFQDVRCQVAIAHRRTLSRPGVSWWRIVSGVRVKIKYTQKISFFQLPSHFLRFSTGFFHICPAKSCPYERECCTEKSDNNFCFVSPLACRTFGLETQRAKTSQLYENSAPLSICLNHNHHNNNNNNHNHNHNHNHNNNNNNHNHNNNNHNDNNKKTGRRTGTRPTS